MKLLNKITTSTLILYVLLILLHLIFLAYQWNNDVLMNDSLDYINAARNFFEHGEFYTQKWTKPLNPEFVTLRPPIYPLFLYVSSLGLNFFGLTFIIQNLLSIVNIVLIARIFKLNQRTEKYNIYLLLSMFFVQQYMYANLVMSEILFQTFIVLLLNFSVLYFNNKKGLYLWLSAFMLVLAFLTKPVMYPLAIFYGLIAIIYVIKNKLYRHLPWAMLPVILLFSYQYLNQIRTGYFHFSSVQTTNLVKYNSTYFIMQMYGTDSANNFKTNVENEAKKLTTFKNKQEYFIKKGKAVITDNAKDYSIFHAKGMARGIFDPGRFDVFSFFKIKQKNNHGFLYYTNKGGLKGVLNYLKSMPVYLAVFLLAVFLLNIVKLFLFLMGIFNKNAPQLPLILGVLLVFYILVASGPLAAARFVIPVSPIYLAVVSLAKIPFSKPNSSINKS